jgi:putative transposase
MPSRNTRKLDVAGAYYHVYARGASKQDIFCEPSDYLYFLYLLERYLSDKQAFSKEGVPYKHFYGHLELLSYCLMPNHYHLQFYQVEEGAMSSMMKSLMTSYCRYFNLKYKRSGSLFEDRYKAAIITNEAHLEHISRYIHLNPRYWRKYEYSSLQYYRDGSEPNWLNTSKVLDIGNVSRDGYINFVEDYEDNRNILSEIKHELADQ